jgi:hypothetical protein
MHKERPSNETSQRALAPWIACEIEANGQGHAEPAELSNTDRHQHQQRQVPSTFDAEQPGRQNAADDETPLYRKAR